VYIVLDVLSDKRGIWFWELVFVCGLYLDVPPVQEVSVPSVLMHGVATICWQLKEVVLGGGH
jgi:hypothetical protein